MVHRSCRGVSTAKGVIALAVIALGVIAPGPVAAQAQVPGPRPGPEPETAPWNEAEIVRLAHARAPGAVIAEAAADLAEARARVAGLRPDPTLSWQREALPGNGASSQDTLQVTVPVDVSDLQGGRRRAWRLLAEADSAAARAEAAALRAEAVAQAVLAFYAAIEASERTRILADAVADLEEAARVLARREEAGMASGYERDRLALEAELAHSRLAQARAALHARQLALVHLLAPERAREPAPEGISGSTALPALAGTLDTQEPAALEVLMARALDQRREVQEVARAARAARGAEDSTGWSWLPRLALSGGVHIARAQDTRHGYVAGLSFELPVFSRGRELRAEAAGQRRMAHARLDAIERQVRREVTEAHQRLVAARQERARFDQATGERVELLGRAAASGYREGHRTIMELLDAQRVRTEVRIRNLALAAEARRADVRLRQATGALQ